MAVTLGLAIGGADANAAPSRELTAAGFSHRTTTTSRGMFGTPSFRSGFRVTLRRSADRRTAVIRVLSDGLPRVRFGRRGMCATTGSLLVLWDRRTRRVWTRAVAPGPFAAAPTVTCPRSAIVLADQEMTNGRPGPRLPWPEERSRAGWTPKAKLRPGAKRTFARANAGTTLTELLQANPGEQPGLGNAEALLTVARDRNITPELVADSLGNAVGVEGPVYLRMLDTSWPYATPCGDQPLERRTQALEWATRQRETLPDLGPRQAGRPTPSTPSSNVDATSPDEQWRLIAGALLEYSIGVARAAHTEPL